MRIRTMQHPGTNLSPATHRQLNMQIPVARPPAKPAGWQVIHVHPGAPAKPPVGTTCNGCGVCCLVEPCPLGAILSRSRHGACAALRWRDDAGRYLCGALTAPGEVLQQTLPGWPGWVHRGLKSLLGRLAARWISAGTGCDCVLEPQRPDNLHGANNPARDTTINDNHTTENRPSQ